MTKFSKAISLFLALVLMLSVFPASAFALEAVPSGSAGGHAHTLGEGFRCSECNEPVLAVDDRGVYYTSFEEAVALDHASRTVKLVQDVIPASSTAFTVHDGSTLTLDLNGHKLGGEGADNLYSVNNYGSFFLIDSAGESGELHGSIYTKGFEEYEELGDDNRILVNWSYGAVTRVQGGKIYGDVEVAHESGHEYWPSENKPNPKLYFENGVLVGGYFSLPDDTRGEIYIEGGKFLHEPPAKFIKSGFEAVEIDGYYVLQTKQYWAGWIESSLTDSGELSEHAMAVTCRNSSVRNFISGDWDLVNVTEQMAGMSFNSETDALKCAMTFNAVSASERTAGDKSVITGMSFIISPEFLIYHGAESMARAIGWDTVNDWDMTIRLPVDAGLACSAVNIYVGRPAALKYANVPVISENGEKYVQFALTSSELSNEISYEAVIKETCVVSYDPNGGSLADGTEEAVRNQIAGGSDVSVIANPFSRANYVFAGWKYGDTVYSEGDVIPFVVDDITLTAQWICINVTVNIIGDGSAMLSNSSGQIYPGEAMPLAPGSDFKLDIFCTDGSIIDSIKVNGNDVNITTALTLETLMDDTVIDITMSGLALSGGQEVIFDGAVSEGGASISGADAVSRAKQNFTNSNVTDFMDTNLMDAVDITAARSAFTEATGIVLGEYAQISAVIRLTVETVYARNDHVSGFTMDITPYMTVIENGRVLGEAVIPNEAITGPVTVRIPVDRTAYMDDAVVYHEDELLGYVKVCGETPNRYIEFTTTSFSTFTVKNVESNTTNHPDAAVGDKGYLTLKDAIEAIDESGLASQRANIENTAYVLDDDASIPNDKIAVINGEELPLSSALNLTDIYNPAEVKDSAAYAARITVARLDAPMLLGILTEPVARAYKADGTTQIGPDYYSLEDAYNAVDERGIILLLKDCDAFTFNGKEVIVNLDGKTIGGEHIVEASGGYVSVAFNDSTDRYQIRKKTKITYQIATLANVDKYNSETGNGALNNKKNLENQSYSYDYKLTGRDSDEAIYAPTLKRKYPTVAVQRGTFAGWYYDEKLTKPLAGCFESAMSKTRPSVTSCTLPAVLPLDGDGNVQWPEDVKLYGRWMWSVTAYYNNYGYVTCDGEKMPYGQAWYFDTFSKPVFRFVPYDGYHVYKATITDHEKKQTKSYSYTPDTWENRYGGTKYYDCGLFINTRIIVTFARGKNFNPLTGDNSNITVYAAASLVSLGLAVSLGTALKKKRKKKAER